MDKLVDITTRGAQVNELGLELDDQRGRQGDKLVNKLFPVTGGGGGQSSQPAVINRYRPGNRYKYVRFNGTVTQFNAVVRDVAFSVVADRENNVINSFAVSQALAGVWEQGSGGPLTTDPALSTDVAGNFGFITTRGLAICNVDAAVVVNEKLGTSATAGRLVTLTTVTPTSAEAAAILAAATGLGVLALETEPPAGFKANLTFVHLQ